MTLCCETVSRFEAPLGLDLAKAFAFYGLDSPAKRLCADYIAAMLREGHIIPSYVKALSSKLKSLDQLHLCKDISDLHLGIRHIARQYDKGYRYKSLMVGLD